jgi:hypothetical protein
MAEIFKTNVQQNKHAEKLKAELSTYFPGSKIKFDLEDCDKILRVEGENITAAKVVELVEKRGFYCTELA